MAQHNPYNPGPVNYLLGHGKFCEKSDPLRFIIALANNLHYIALASKYTKKNGYALVELHSAYLVKFFIQVRDVLVADNPDKTLGMYIDGILAEYMKYVQQFPLLHNTPDAQSVKPYVQYVSKDFKIADNELYIADDGHKLSTYFKSYDIKSFKDRADLMTLSPEHYKVKIRSFQKEHMDFNENSITRSWEIRERMIWYPHREVSIENDTTPLTPDIKQYLKLLYEVRELEDYKGITKNNVRFQVYINKSALKYDILKLEHDASPLIQYTQFEPMTTTFKSGSLSGKHFILMYLECKKQECIKSKSHMHCDKFLSSTLANTCVSELHILVDAAILPLIQRDILPDAMELRKFVTLVNAQYDLRDPLPVQDASQSFKDYDLAMPDSTVVLGSCSGHDTVVNKIFGFES